jgi:hypothetical protein
MIAMKLVSTRFIIVCCLTVPLALQLAAQEPTLPSWVVPEMENLPTKKVTLPPYLQITQAATIARPKPLTQADDLEKLNPGLLKTLPRLKELLTKATVSPKFKRLYDAKVESVQGGNHMPVPSFYDTATALSFKDEKSGRSVFLFQSDMDTDTDGTDPGRLSQLKDYDDARLSRTFQPLLSYSWNKPGTDTPPNPFLKYFDDTLGKLRGLQKQIDAFATEDHGPIWQDLKKHMDEQVASLERRSKYYRSDLIHRRSLIASLDPFIVVPQTWIDPQMSVGDFVAVVHAGRVYPCIIADTGPTTKSGEASQRLCRALNPKASGRVSAVTTPAVTYIVFPGTRTAKGVPDLARYKSEVNRLIGEIGGLGEGVTLHTWE